jgi:hypothetical protein
MARFPIASIALDVASVDSTELFLPSGDVFDWTVGIMRDVAREARILCPPGHSNRRASTRYVNTNRLRGTIRSKAVVAGRRLDAATVSVGPARDPSDKNGNDYAMFVLGGTGFQGTRYIYSRRGFAHKVAIDAVITRRGVTQFGRAVPEDLNPTWRMKFRTDGGKHFRVHGQRRNPFLFSAYNRIARRHSGALAEFDLPFLRG